MDNRARYMISVAADIVGMHPQTLRIYEQRGLVNPQRTAGNTRLYSDDDIERLNKEIRAAMASPDLAERFIALGLEPATSPEEFSAFVKSEVDKWGKVVKASGLKPD